MRQMICVFRFLSERSWVSSSFLCLGFVVCLCLRCFLGVFGVFLCWTIEYVSWMIYVLVIGYGSVGLRVYCPGRVCHGVERSGGWCVC